MPPSLLSIGSRPGTQGFRGRHGGDFLRQETLQEEVKEAEVLLDVTSVFLSIIPPHFIEPNGGGGAGYCCKTQGQAQP